MIWEMSLSFDAPLPLSKIACSHKWIFLTFSLPSAPIKRLSGFISRCATFWKCTCEEENEKRLARTITPSLSPSLPYSIPSPRSNPGNTAGQWLRPAVCKCPRRARVLLLLAPSLRMNMFLIILATSKIVYGKEERGRGVGCITLW
jgi:hypothetical protein